MLCTTRGTTWCTQSNLMPRWCICDTKWVPHKYKIQNFTIYYGYNVAFKKITLSCLGIIFIEIIFHSFLVFYDICDEVPEHINSRKITNL